jgi:hypothetical protein
MNRQQFIREIETTIRNDLCTSEYANDLTKEEKEETVQEMLESATILFDIMHKDNYFIGRAGVKY